MYQLDAFKIIEDSFDKDRLRFFESIMSIGNEYMGMRGNFEENYSEDSMRGTYIGGIWYPDQTKVGWWKNGYPKYFGKVINSPNFIGIDVKINGESLDLSKENILSFKWTLDMEKGYLERDFIIKRNGDKEDKYHVNVKRFLSIDNRKLCVIRYDIIPLDNISDISFRPYIDANVKNEDSNYDENFWELLKSSSNKNKGYILVKTKKNSFNIEQFSVCDYMGSKCFIDNKEIENFDSYDSEDKIVSNAVFANLSKNQVFRIEKYIAVTTDRDNSVKEIVKEAEDIVDTALKEGFDSLFKKNSSLWRERWDIADVEIDDNISLQQAIRYNIFQLFSTFYGSDNRLNIGPKGFTGEKYGGATYWDTEAFIIPMYLSITPNEVTKNLLFYRYNQLDGAYHNAKEQGLDGALYPMVTFNGVECHNEWEITFEEIHRNGAIAYAIYNYTNYTGDYSYVKKYGIKVLVGISKFWADRVHYNKERSCYMIHGVTGPNEYENNVNNNWYTNKIAGWTLKYTLEILDKFKGDSDFYSLKELELDESDLSFWKDVIAKLYFPFDEKRGIFVQHDTFLDKELRTVDTIDKRPINQNWSWDKILRSCFIKQADVLQGIYLFNNEFNIEEKKRNFEFYEPMTVHESSLSASIHSILACELGLKDKAVELFERTIRLDLDNYNNDTEDGLHITSMSGGWLSIVHGFAGMRTYDESLRFNPILPNSMSRYSFKINYRDRLIGVSISENGIRLNLERGKAIKLYLYDEEVYLDDELLKELK